VPKASNDEQNLCALLLVNINGLAPSLYTCQMNLPSPSNTHFSLKGISKNSGLPFSSREGPAGEAGDEAVKSKVFRDALNPLFFLLALLLSSCGLGENPLFEKVDSKKSNIHFSNTLTENEEFNVSRFEYVYNGGGVAVGDINNDGLEDVFFTGNTVSSALYLNKGGLVFEDVTEKAGTTTTQWCTGVTMTDINYDGFLDIYVCVSGHIDSLKRRNLLFVNNQDNTFSEQAAKYGLADGGYSTQALFFDYDRDDDLDMYLLNHSNGDRDANTITPIMRNGLGHSTDKLFNRNGDIFKDVSKAAGITVEGYGLGVGVGDFNNDHWPDLYIANDYIYNDLLYINNRDGTFGEVAKQWLPHTSQFSMGTDVADINDDGWQDVLVMDMLPPDNERQKLLSGPMAYERFKLAEHMGYIPQFMRNTVQMNTGLNSFSEVGRMLNLHQTDWSWSVLAADFNNDAHKDIYVTNGYLKNITDRDFALYTYHNRQGRVREGNERLAINKALEELPGAKLSNVLFMQQDGFQFLDKSKKEGVAYPSFSNGAAYADLDNDGDYDLLVNNLNDKAFLFENQSDKQNPKNHFLKLSFKGDAKNPWGEGVKLKIETELGIQYFEKHSVRGYLSSSSQNMVVGLGPVSSIKMLEAVWPNGATQILNDISADQSITLELSKANLSYSSPSSSQAVDWIDVADSLGIDYTHQEKEYSDFSFQPLLPWKYSDTGPMICVGDANNDSLEDFLIGGSVGHAAILYFQQPDGHFRKKEMPFSESDFEDTDAAFFDADSDGDNDLIVVSGSNEFFPGMPLYQPRLYKNDGTGNFVRSGGLPFIQTNAACVAVADYDQDGDGDIFIGGSIYPGRYPLPDKSFLLQNHEGRFEDITAKINSLSTIGIVRSAVWADINNDRWLDLTIAGDWMAITTFINQKGKLVKTKNGLEDNLGFWNTIEPTDIDKDGDVDLLVGNLGNNTTLKVDKDSPAVLIANDFDKNGSFDPIFFSPIQGELFPVASRDMMLEQLPFMKKRFTSYKDYSKAGLNETLTKAEREGAYRLAINETSSGICKNEGGQFQFTQFPQSLQVAPIQSIKIVENGWFIGGNRLSTEVAGGQYDAFPGLILYNPESLKVQITARKEEVIEKPISRPEVKVVKLITLTGNRKGILVGSTRCKLTLLTKK
jgi:enediyne biosynthesis protein E4